MSDTQYVTCYRGEALTLTVTMDPAEDLTGRSITFTLCDPSGPKGEPGGVRATKTTAGGEVLITNGPGGVFDVTLTSADTDRDAPAQCPFDAWDTDAGSEASLAHGALLILPRQRA